MSSRLFKLAKKAQRDSGLLLEFLEELSKVESITILQGLLEEYYCELGGAILLQMHSVLGDSVDIHIGLARWYYLNGMDPGAASHLEQAKEISPEDKNVLMFAVWMLFDSDPSIISKACSQLMEAFPECDWGRDVLRRLAERGELNELEEPLFTIRWGNTQHR